MNDDRDADDPAESAPRFDALLLDDLLDGGHPHEAALLARLEADADGVARLAERAALHAALRRSAVRGRLSAWGLDRARAATPGSSGKNSSPVFSPDEDLRLSRVPRTRDPIPADQPDVFPRPAGRRPMWSVAGAVAAAVVVAGVFVAGQAWSARRPAVVTRVIGSALAGGAPLSAGDVVGRGRVDLRVGLLALRTRHGAEIVIEAPAAFSVESLQRLRLFSGRLSAEVPAAARGFTVVTPAGEAVDLGTRFAVDILPSGESEVHVFDGEVVTRAGASGRPRSLRDGQAATVAANEPREFRTAAFIRSDEVAGIAAAVADGRQRRAVEALDSLRRDPATVAVVDFEEVSAAADTAGGQCRMLQGRWPGSRAAEFSAVGDHFPVDVGGDGSWPQLTLSAWVRIDRLGQPYQSMYHTDGWQADRPGQVHWMITRECVMRLALRHMRLAAGAVETDGYPDSRTPVVGSRGRWMHLATVYDSEARVVRFYVDGRPDGETRLEHAPPARLGSARIGNWNRDDRRLSGRIDELVIVGRALSDAEIAAVHAAGTPYGGGEGGPR